MRDTVVVLVGVIVVIVAIVAIVGLPILAMARPANVSVEVEGDRLVVRPRGLDRFWCFRGAISIPPGQVTDVRVASRDELRPSWLRLPGTYVPGVIMAGSYGVGARRTFWDVRRGRRLLVVDCVPGNDSGYRQLVLQVPDPDSLVAQLRQGLLLHRRD